MSRLSLLLTVFGVLAILACTYEDSGAMVAAADDLSAPVDPDDYYAILELPAREDASERDVKSNWRSLSRKYHPDLHGEKTRTRYQQIQGAYEVLSDRRKRKVYDMKGLEGLKQLEQAKQQGDQPQDPILRMMGFGGGGGNVNRGKNVNLVMLITLEDAYNGASHTVKLSKNKLCRKCRGTGADSKADYQKCPHCDGRGAVMQRIQLAPGFVQQMQQQCGHCSGKGQIVKKKCSACRGRKVVPAEQMISVDVEQGTNEGTELTFEMEADQSPDQLPGDVVFTVQTAPHATFTRKGSDLEMEMQLTLAEALLGFERSVTHLDEHTFTVAESDPVQSGQKRVVKDEGMPVHHVPSEKGKLTVTYRVKFPDSLTDAQKKIIAATL